MDRGFLFFAMKLMASWSKARAGKILLVGKRGGLGCLELEGLFLKDQVLVHFFTRGC